MAEVRLVQKEDIQQLSYLMSQAFQRGSRDGLGNESEWPETTTWGMWEGDELRSAVTIEHYQVHLGENVIAPMGGIAGVACLPADRGRGYARTLLRRSLETMREQGQYISALYPFSWDYYRKFGWEWVGVKREYTLPTTVLNVSPETDRVRAASTHDYALIKQVYTEFSKRYRGMLARDDRLWNRTLNDEDKKYTFRYLYEGDNGPEGYIIYRHGEGDMTHLREFIALTPHARRGLLGLLHRLDMQIPKIKISAAGDDTLWMEQMHWDFDTKIWPVNMGRVVDIPQAFGAWSPVLSAIGKVCFSVRDEHAPWNDGSWHVMFENGICQVNRSHDEPQVEMDIQALSQLYWGTPTAKELRAAGRLSVHDERGYLALQDLMQGPPMCMFDGF
jgi:predicted acetyltransferase